MKHRSIALSMGAAVAMAMLVFAAPAGAASGPWQAVKAATARYHSLGQATAAGYSAQGEPCVASPAGTMGIHAVNGTLASDLVIDALRPEIMLYLPDASGELGLVAVEYFEVALANSGSGPIPWFGASPPAAGFFNPAPSVVGHTFDGPMPGHNPSMPWHYDLHVWLWTDNPDGQFAPFNPAIACPA